jgi:hypothetical protein
MRPCCDGGSPLSRSNRVSAQPDLRRGETHSTPANAELRRLIREGFEEGISGEQLAEAAGLSVPRV